MQITFLGLILLVSAVPVLGSTAKAKTASEMSLPQLVAARFGNLSRAEERLANAAATGETANCADLSAGDKNIRGDLLSWLCTNPQATAQLTYRGVSVDSAEIIGRVDLEWVRLSFPIRVSNCAIRDLILLNGGHIAFLSLAGSTMNKLEANGAYFEGTVRLCNRFKAERGVVLTRAKIDGDLDCADGQFVGMNESPAFDANGIEVKGNVFLRNGFKAQGGADLGGAKIDGDLDCQDGQFVGMGESLAFNANSIEVKRNVFLRNGFKAEGGANLTGAKIDGVLECEGGQFVGKDEGPALNANSIEVRKIVHLDNGFKAEGGVDLTAAKIDSGLECEGGQFIGNDKALALTASAAEVKHGIFLRNGFKAEGGVNLVAAKIDGNLNCAGGQFVSNDKVPAFDAGRVRIEGDFDCEGGQFIGNDKALALNANGGEVKYAIFLRNGFKAEGGVDLVAAKIGGDLDCGGGQFISNGKTSALNASEANIEGVAIFNAGFAAKGNVDFVAANANVGLVWSDVRSPEKAILDLRLSKIGKLLNDRNSWLNQGCLRIDGFVYDQIHAKSPPTAEFQLGWVRLQPQDRFLPQPFEQLAAVLRKMGLEEEARKVMIAKNQEHAQYVQGQPEWLWYGLFGHLIGYGYTPWRAFFISLIVILIGWAAFRRGYCRGLITPTGGTEYMVENGEAQPVSKDYPKFNALVYSLETFVPIVKLGIAEHWEPNGNRDAYFVERSWLMTGGCLRSYLWFHIIAGWVLTTLWVGGITGLVKT